MSPPRPTQAIPLLQELDARAAESKSVHREWERHWHLSLPIANAAALTAVSSAILGSFLTSGINDRTDVVLHWALLPSAWIFVCGLLAGAMLPFVGMKRVARVPETVSAIQEEILSGGPTGVPDGKGGTEYSRAIIKDNKKNDKRWSIAFVVCEYSSIGCFLMGLLWLLLLFTTWSYVAPLAEQPTGSIVSSSVKPADLAPPAK